MPPPSPSSALYLKLLPKTFYVYQIPSDASYSSGLFDHLMNDTHGAVRGGGRTAGPFARFVSITRTRDEISIVVDESIDAELSRHGVRLDPSKKSPWRCVAVNGPMEFSLIGVLCDLTTPLKLVGISIFAISTWNTDYLLVPYDKAEDAVQALKNDSWTFTDDVNAVA
ncbi:ACT domain-containing protein [Cantharellus anzutake]|uniref:ACT domain-containing protein n=1 Tax=Cantharellus anzutake TaxID=1750568 RepID=UPI0019033824|nr:ACT domain-containing protein [Cantharellus anzutake]KAF8342302.1 ACT domain-containing protein [Cantharellus anzutake]